MVPLEAARSMMDRPRNLTSSHDCRVLSPVACAYTASRGGVLLPATLEGVTELAGIAPELCRSTQITAYDRNEIPFEGS